MQELSVKVKKNGQEVRKTIKVIRLWTSGSGTQLFQFGDASYGYKDGSPVREETELNIIPSKIQREMALRWWNNGGKEKSEEFYADKDREERERLGDIQRGAASSDSALDEVLYQFRHVAVPGKKRDAWSDPFAWMNQFPNRPDWWGVANKLEISAFEYRIATVESVEKTEKDDLPDSPGLGTDVASPGDKNTEKQF